MDFLNDFVGFFSSPLFKLVIQMTTLFFVILWVAAVAWTYRDAEARGASAIYWAAVVLVFSFLGLIIYLILRPAEFKSVVQERELEMKAKEVLMNEAALVCPECHRSVEGDYLICPHCMKKLKNPCPSCAKPLKPSWVACPYCRTTL